MTGTIQAERPRRAGDNPVSSPNARVVPPGWFSPDQFAGAVVVEPAAGGVVAVDGAMVEGAVVVVAAGAVVLAGAVVVLAAGGVAALSSEPEHPARVRNAEAQRAIEILFMANVHSFELGGPSINAGPLRSIRRITQNAPSPARRSKLKGSKLQEPCCEIEQPAGRARPKNDHWIGRR